MRVPERRAQEMANWRSSSRARPGDLRAIVGKAAERHGEVARAVRLAATRGSRDLSQLRAEVDRGLRASWLLGCHDSRRWALEARPVVKEIRDVRSPWVQRKGEPRRSGRRGSRGRRHAIRIPSSKLPRRASRTRSGLLL